MPGVARKSSAQLIGNPNRFGLHRFATSLGYPSPILGFKDAGKRAYDFDLASWGAGHHRMLEMGEAVN
jgi:hypothetical protein